MLGTALGLATLCLVVPRLRDCASANGMAQMARSRSRMSALQRRCALIEEFCFFIVLSLEFWENSRKQSAGGTNVRTSWGNTLIAKNQKRRQDLSYIFF